MARATRDRLLFLRKSADIERVKREGRRLQTPYFNLLSCASESPSTRIGIVVGKRLGTAVVRNRVKRMFREMARGVRFGLVAGRDVVVFPRREALSVPHHNLRAFWSQALHQVGLWKTDSDLPCKHSVSD